MRGRNDSGATRAPAPARAAARRLRAISRRGTNQTGVRLYNERLVLSLIRRHGSLPKAEIARLTGLSPQTISVIMHAARGRRPACSSEDAQRGKIGQPSVPFSLNPDGAFSLGLKIGRRSVDLDPHRFRRRRCAPRCTSTYPYPDPDGIVDFVAPGHRAR